MQWSCVQQILNSLVPDEWHRGAVKAIVLVQE